MKLSPTEEMESMYDGDEHTHTFTMQTIMLNIAISILSESIVLKHIFYTLSIRLKLKSFKKNPQTVRKWW